MSQDKQKNYFKHQIFKPSININSKQVITIIIILLVFVSIPFVINYFQSPNKGAIKETIAQTVESFKIKTFETDSPFTVNIPIINKDLDLTIIKQNPQLVTYIGLGMITVAILVGIALIKNLR